jgi:hypothetical protein
MATLTSSKGEEKEKDGKTKKGGRKDKMDKKKGVGLEV